MVVGSGALPATIRGSRMDAYGISVLVRGSGEYASAIARELFLAGNAVAIQQVGPPSDIRRLRCYADAWHCEQNFIGSIALDGVFARRVDSLEAMKIALRRRDSIPMITLPLDPLIEMWPWSVLVDGRMNGGVARPQRNLAGLSIGLGPGFLGGETVDIVIGTDDANPGTFVPAGLCAAAPRENQNGPSRRLCTAPQGGIFHAAARIGDTVHRGDCVGWLGALSIHVPDHAPGNSRIRGLPRDGATLAEGDEILDLAPPGARISGVSTKARQITRAVMLAIASDGQMLNSRFGGV
jgi:xanthine dehydrogenase accessory factor